MGPSSGLITVVAMTSWIILSLDFSISANTLKKMLDVLESAIQAPIFIIMKAISHYYEKALVSRAEFANVSG